MSPSLLDLKGKNRSYNIKGMVLRLNKKGAETLRRSSSLPIEENSRLVFITPLQERKVLMHFKDVYPVIISEDEDLFQDPEIKDNTGSKERK